MPEGLSREERLETLVASGFILQAGEKLVPIDPVITGKEAQEIAQLVSENRDVDYLP